jgi:hypothetical protein
MSACQQSTTLRAIAALFRACLVLSRRGALSRHAYTLVSLTHIYVCDGWKAL